MRLNLKKVAVTLVVLLFGVVSIISINHLFPLLDNSVSLQRYIGFIGWLSISSSLILLSRGFRLQTLSVFLIFFLFCFWRGPFLEPPSDPLEHLRRIHSIASEDYSITPKVNGGFWHYNMVSLIVNSGQDGRTPNSILQRIDVAHGLIVGLLISGLFILGKRSGLISRWSFFGCLLAFLFFGTNRFSYFSYYSLAPGSTSLLIIWIWVSFFFFRKDRTALILGSFFGLLFLPILLINHRQEAVFLCLAIIVWWLLNCYFAMESALKKKNRRKAATLRALFFLSIFAIFFIVPQFGFIKDFLSSFFVHNYWQSSQDTVFKLYDFHLWGDIWKGRVKDTLGYIAIAMIILTVPYFWSGFVRQQVEKKIRIWTLAFLPFFGFFLPLFHFIWLSNVRIDAYYRLCYISFFWLLFAHFFQGLEGRFYLLIKKSAKKYRNTVGVIYEKHIVRFVYLIVCCSIIVVLGTIRNSPVYGKLPFIMLDSRPWWPEWQPMVDELLEQGQNDKPILTDTITSTVMSGAFGQNTIYPRSITFPEPLLVEELDVANEPSVNIFPSGALTILLGDSLIVKQEIADYIIKNIFINEKKGERPFRCVVNIHGFTPSWVPFETGHWNPEMADTKRFYSYHFTHVKDLSAELIKFPPQYCNVFF